MRADLLRGSLLQDASERAQRIARPVLVSITRPVAPEDPLTFFATSPAAERLLWHSPNAGESIVGVGAAHILDIHGPSRFADARLAWSTLMADAIVDDPLDNPWSGPLALGGFSFDPLRPRTSLWDGFPDARLIVPERVLVQRGGRAWLTNNTLVGAATVEPCATPPLSIDDDEPSPEAWRQLVRNVARGIRQRTLGIEKVVLARATHVRHHQPLDPAVALGRLRDAYPTCTIFGVAHADACFVGATPERLVALNDGVAITAALAGSTRRGATPDEDARLGQALLDDPKERAEHGFVVRALHDGLSQVSHGLIADAEPRLRQLPNVQHLWTPIRANVLPGTTILDLVERLHPTPAMGGHPTQPALALLRTEERLDRGWYASPVGWLNRRGDGEFVVGIRSALLRGQDATLFAGCGIVADSDADAEFAELGWKLRPMLAALDIDAP